MQNQLVVKEYVHLLSFITIEFSHQQSYNIQHNLPKYKYNNILHYHEKTSSKQYLILLKLLLNIFPFVTVKYAKSNIEKERVRMK